MTGSAFSCSSGGTAVSCSASPASDATNNYLTITEWVCSGNCASGTSFSLTISGARNPYIQSTNDNEFIIDVKASDGSAIFYSNAIDATPALSVGLVSNIAIAFANSVYVGQTGQYTFTFTTQSEIVQNGKVFIKFPAGRVVDSGSGSMTCTDGASTTYSCTYTYGTNLLVSITNICTSAACPAGTYTIKLTGRMRNPSSVPSISESWIIYTTDSADFFINEGTLADSSVTAIQPYPMTTATVDRGSPSLATSTYYEFTFKTVNSVGSSGAFRFILPGDQVVVPFSGYFCY